MFDKIFNKCGVGVALLLMFAELTYVNSKSLIFLAAEKSLIDVFFSIIGAMAFSVVTILVMRKSRDRWVKLTFPVFDALLVFCGYNLLFASDIESGTDNQVRFWMSVFMSIFTGLITFSLGLINYNDHAGNASESTAELVRISTEHNQIVFELNAKLEEERSKRAQTETLAAALIPNHLRYVAWQSKKKNESNRTTDETKAIQFVTRLNAGETIALREVVEL